MKKLVALLGLVLAIALVATGCGGGGAAQTTDLGMVKLTDDMRFQPDALSAPVGKIKVTLENTGTQVHDFAISGTDYKFSVPAGQKATHEFEIKKAGEYEVVCTQPGHKDAGMKAKLTVTK